MLQIDLLKEFMQSLSPVAFQIPSSEKWKVAESLTEVAIPANAEYFKLKSFHNVKLRTILCFQ